ncbi:MAG: tRNA pseudouridine(38-40) synthase TruA [Deltaproteobacteria bacterium]|nr:tRNA pseudouridine(38-40) synthase TruA [Deltaproteobacteria bacterium]MBW2218069.1 tRNA pseudouridine(38-40) synthase TruA [Deltaproteobacteria bacterium]
MLKNFKLTIEYDGTDYHGWQIQKNDRTIQQEIEIALFTMTGERITLVGSGRTDAGVHALGQVANFTSKTKLAPDNFQNGLNSLIPEDIIIRECCLVDKQFHARFSAKSKTYHYQILNRKTPSAVGRQYEWFISQKLDIEAMKAAACHISGTHDFKAFEGTGSPRSHTTRSVITADIERDNDRIAFRIKADGFLRYMVRNLTGTLVDVGLLKINPEDIKSILASKDRSLAGPTAPPHGLFLINVEY